MKTSILLSVLVAGGVAVGWAPAQQGPRKEGSETVARPRKKEAPETPEGPKIPSTFGKKEKPLPEGVPVFRSDVTTISVDVSVLTSQGQPIPKLRREHFRLLEDNVPQQVSGFATGESPMTVAMVIEFSNLFQRYWTETWYQTLSAAYGFLETLRPEDYVAIVAYDIRPEILSDFSTDKRAAFEAMRRLQIAAYSESNLYDAITDTADRMSGIEGRKAMVLITSGMDTFSKLTFDQTRKILQNAGVPIYAIGLMQALREWYDARGYLGPIARMDFLQADNQLRVFTKETGGVAFFPRFYGEFPGIFRAISEALRMRYELTYVPTNLKRDGKFRKLKVELVDPATGQPLKIADERNRPLRYTVIAKAGYTAPREVE